MIKTQLLCSFCTEDTLEATLKSIARSYQIAFDSIYVLENVDVPGALCLTYNINSDSAPVHPLPPSTISLHRKKAFNSLYTINALNALVAEQNGGKQDPKFQVDWAELKNTILVVQYGSLKRIRTKIREIVKVDTISLD